MHIKCYTNLKIDNLEFDNYSVVVQENALLLRRHKYSETKGHASKSISGGSANNTTYATYRKHVKVANLNEGYTRFQGIVPDNFTVSLNIFLFFLFITALFVTAKIWKQPTCPSIGDWINLLTELLLRYGKKKLNNKNLLIHVTSTYL